VADGAVVREFPQVCDSLLHALQGKSSPLDEVVGWSEWTTILMEGS
jgi:hypothetical protein